ncbi:hypothetical protein PENTCL1PPCAC_12138, partial [Pristionchus entomophagus]
GDLLEIFDDGTEKRGETTFMDLPDEMSIKIIANLDLPSQFKMRRVSRGFNELQLCVKNMLQTIEIKIIPDRYEMSINPCSRNSPWQCHNYDELIQGLRRLALNTSINRITIREELGTDHIMIEDCLMDTLFNFEADELITWNDKK